MPRIRTIKPEFWTDSTMVQLPVLARLLYIGMWNFADDAGALADDPDQIKLQVLPAEPTDVHGLIDLLVACERMARYESEDGHRYLVIVHFIEHQKIDHPSPSRVIREPSRKLAIPLATRRVVAKKYGCEAGEEKAVSCYYCGEPGSIKWWRKADGTPASWVTFSHLELDHFVPEDSGGTGEPPNIVLSCRACNRSKGTQDGLQFAETSRALASPREEARTLALEGKGREEDKEGKGRESEAPAAPTRPPKPSKVFVPPTDEEALEWFTAHQHPEQAVPYMLHYRKVGWVCGKARQPMKCWKSAASEWLVRQPLFDAERIAAKRENGRRADVGTLQDSAARNLQKIKELGL